MATRIKTIEYHFPVLASLTNNTLTNLPQITVYLPENSKVFRSVLLKVTCDDIITATGGSTTTRTLNLRLGSATYTSITNATVYNNSGENISWLLTGDFTNHFQSNWTGNSMTCDVQVQINQSTGTTLGMVNVCGTLYITYEYDDTSTTQTKTVHIPLAQIIGALPTAKPGTAQGQIPALDTYLPEANKTYRDIAFCFWGNANQGSTTDHIVTMQIDSGSSVATGIYEGALSSDRYTEYNWVNPSFTTNATHDFFIWTSTGAVSRHHNPLIFITVTYEFTLSGTSSVMNSLLVPFELFGHGDSTTRFERVITQLNIQEPNPSLQRLGALVWYQNENNTSNTYARIGTGSYSSAISTGGSGVRCGNETFMLINNSPSGIVFQQGYVDLIFDYYSTSAYRPRHINGLWMINYTSGIANSGIGSHNHTVMVTLLSTITPTTAYNLATTSRIPLCYIPEQNYYLNSLSVGTMQTNTNMIHATLTLEGLSSEGYSDNLIPIRSQSGLADAEVGIEYNFLDILQSTKVRRFPDDLGAGGKSIDVKNSRHIKVEYANGYVGAFFSLFTYHSITKTISGVTYDNNGNILGSATVYLFKADMNNNNYSPIKSTGSDSTTGEYSFTVYDSEANYFVVARKTGSPNVFDVTDFILQGQ